HPNELVVKVQNAASVAIRSTQRIVAILVWDPSARAGGALRPRPDTLNTASPPRRTSPAAPRPAFPLPARGLAASRATAPRSPAPERPSTRATRASPPPLARAYSRSRPPPRPATSSAPPRLAAARASQRSPSAA